MFVEVGFIKKLQYFTRFNDLKYPPSKLLRDLG